MPTSATPPTEWQERNGRRAVAHGARLARGVVGCLLGVTALCFFGVTALWGCTGATTRTALQGDLTQLQSEVSRAERDGELSRSTVRELATAVLERELSSLREPLDRFPELAPCAREVRGILKDVAQGSDEPAAFATLTLLDAGLDAPHEDVDADSPPALRMVLARRALGLAAGAQRRALMLHGDADVRRAALEAAAHSGDVADVHPLLDVARLDPDVLSRAIALRALGSIGGQEVVVGLADLWAVADTELRLHIIKAWALAASFDSGGRAQLVRAAEVESGIVAVTAALVLARGDAESVGLATTLLSSALRGSDATARLLALYEVPWSNPELQSLVREAQSSPDAAARWVALFRQVEQGNAPEPARQALRVLATENGAAVGLLARVALARAGDASVKAALQVDLKAARGRERMLAALALAALKEWGAAAHALADDSPSVRQAVACQLLSEPPAEAAPEQSRAELFGPLAPQLTRELLSGQVSTGPSGS